MRQRRFVDDGRFGEYRAIAGWTPEFPDQIALEPGDTVTSVTRIDGTWCKATVVDSGQRGQCSCMDKSLWCYCTTFTLSIIILTRLFYKYMHAC